MEIKIGKKTGACDMREYHNQKARIEHMLMAHAWTINPIKNLKAQGLSGKKESIKPIKPERGKILSLILLGGMS
jgi:hypothetical protein